MLPLLFLPAGLEGRCASPLCIRAHCTLPPGMRTRRRLVHELICVAGGQCSINQQPQHWLDADTVYIHSGPQVNKTQQASAMHK